MPKAWHKATMAAVSIAAVSLPINAYATTTGTTVNVSSASGLKSALSNAKPGQTIALADGTYTGLFTINRPGTSSARITLKGSSKAIIKGSGTSGSDYTLSLENADYWQLTGFTVTGGNKGIMLDSTNNTIMSNLDVGNTAQEAVHFRNFSTDNTLQNSKIHDTGLGTPDYGEGVYIGSAKSNWSSASGGKPDASDRNKILNNTITRTKAESIDVKEASSNGTITGNLMDGSLISGANSADSLMDVKGNGYNISSNTLIGKSSHLLDGFQTHQVVSGWGKYNTFASNNFTITAPGYAINLSGSPQNTVKCSNTTSGTSKGLSTSACTP